MKSTMEMFRNHPLDPICDSEKMAAVIAAINICGQACTTCADACLNEQDIGPLVGCIRVNQDCADICNATSAILSRLTKGSPEVLKAAVEACAIIAGACADECEKHGDKHTHCRLCKAACISCEKECRNFMELLL